jgi:septal ring factor EnvC (AmiA/AmiB activator)
MADSASTATSLEDRTEDLDAGAEENPTRDTLAEGLLCLIRPTIDSLETQVSSTLTAQSELKDQIVTLQTSLKSLQQQHSCPVDLDSYIVKLSNTKKRVTVVANILSAAQDRLTKVHQNCLKETARRRALLEPSPTTTPGPEEPARLPK